MYSHENGTKSHCIINCVGNVYGENGNIIFEFCLVNWIETFKSGQYPKVECYTLKCTKVIVGAPTTCRDPFHKSETLLNLVIYINIYRGNIGNEVNKNQVQ